MSLEEQLAEIRDQFSGQFAVYAEHLGTGEVVAFGAVNDPFETASVLKVPVLVEALRQCRDGLHQLDELVESRPEDFVKGSGILQSLTQGLALPLKDVLTLMIIVSDNEATNMVLRTVGIEAVNERCRALGLTQTEIKRNIKFDPPGTLALSSPADLVRLFKGLYEGTVLEEPWRTEALDILEKQHYNTLLTRAMPYALLEEDDETEKAPVRVLSKSGSLTGIRNDAGLVLTPWGNYAIALMSVNSTDERFHVDTEAHVLLPQVTRAIFDHFIPPSVRGDAGSAEAV